MNSLWQVRIKLTQAPHPFFANPFDENPLLEWQETESFRIFLYDPVGSNPPKSYGLEFHANKKLDVTFFTTANLLNNEPVIK